MLIHDIGGHMAAACFWELGRYRRLHLGIGRSCVENFFGNNGPMNDAIPRLFPDATRRTAFSRSYRDELAGRMFHPIAVAS
jgi:hypothetical protein